MRKNGYLVSNISVDDNNPHNHISRVIAHIVNNT